MLTEYNTYRGGSLRDIGPLYRSPHSVQFGRNIYFQNGQGLGSVLRGVWNFLTPIFKSSSKAIGSELLKGGAEILDNLEGGKDLKSLFQEQKEKRIKNLTNMAVDKLANLQRGSGLRIKRLKASDNSLIKGIVFGRKGRKKRKSLKSSKTKTSKKKRKKRTKKTEEKIADLFA